MSKAWLDHLGERIRARRKYLGMSQEDLAGAAELHATYISHLENGRRNVSFITLVLIAHALELEIEELVADKRFRTPR